MNRRLLAAFALLVTLATIAYWGHWRGEFVYDDVPQIVNNSLLRSTEGTGRALTKDVWAFKGERAEAWSNYWRPAFVLWLALNYRVFGLESTLGWHWANLALHMLASCLALQLLRRAAFPYALALAAAAVFAVHPVHLESVAWISGVPDVLATCLLIGSFLVLPDPEDPRHGLRWTGSLLLYAFALLTKEVSVLAPLVVLSLDAAQGGGQFRVRRSLLRAAPFAATAALFLAARRSVLGFTAIEVPWHLDAWEMLLTMPRLLGFYLRQAFLPLELGPSYPLRAATQPAGPADLVAVLALAVAAGLLVYLTRHRRSLQFALSIAILPLLPAMNVNAFIPEQIVHDRYLYLPVLGAWAAALAAAWIVLERLDIRRPKLWGWALVGMVIVLFTVQTRSNVGTWATEHALWAKGVSVDQGSAFNWAQFGLAQAARGNMAVAVASFDRSLAIVETPPALMGRADVHLQRGELALAEADLRKLVDAQPDNSAAVERLAALFQQTGRLDRAAETFIAGRDRIPHRRCTFTAGLGVVYYLSGNPAAALGELESISTLVTPESLPPCQLGLFQLGALYLELGRLEDARRTLELFLAVTRLVPLDIMAQRRRQAEGWLAQLEERPAASTPGIGPTR